MSVDLNVWSSHNLKFNSFEEGITAFEEKTSSKIKPWNPGSGHSIIKTKRIPEIEYFINFETSKRHFDRWKEIRIWTSFEFCNELQLFGKTLKINPAGFRTRYSKWQELVTGVFEDLEIEEIEKINEYRENWLLFRKYSQEISLILGGEKIIYINDHSFQTEEDVFYQGESLESGIELLHNKIEPCHLDLLESLPKVFRASNTWYYENPGAGFF